LGLIFWAPGRSRSGRRRRADARCGWPDVGTGFFGLPGPRLRRGPGSLLIFNRLRPAIRRGAHQRAAAAPQPSFRGDGARSRRLFLTHRPPGCPLKCAGGPLLPCKRGGRGSPLVAPPPRQAYGGPPAHNRSHPWRDNKVRAINRASTMKHPSLIETSGFMLVHYCKH